MFRGTSGIAQERGALLAPAEQGTAGADMVIAFVSVESGYDGESSDRPTLDLAPGQPTEGRHTLSRSCSADIGSMIASAA